MISPLTVFTDARLVLPDRVVKGWLAVEEGRITALGPGAPDLPAGTEARTVALGGRYLAPGLVDVHCHGAAGAVVYSGVADDLALVAQAHLQRGTTSMLASAATIESSAMTRAAGVVSDAVGKGEIPNLAGLHLEGPFLSPVRRGAQLESALRMPDPGLAGELFNAAGDIPIMMTIAPELDGAIALIDSCASRCRFAVGHTDARYEQVIEAVNAGARHVTHLFNAMAPLEHRQPGPIAAALTDERLTYELIADGHHVLPPVLQLAAAADGGRRTVLVTDASVAAGLGDGHYRFAGREVDVVDGVVRRAGTDRLAGSTAFLIDCVRHMITDVGVGLVDAFRMASQTPAGAAGLADRGALFPGNRADLLILGLDLHLQDVYCGGVLVTPSPHRDGQVPSPS